MKVKEENKLNDFDEKHHYYQNSSEFNPADKYFSCSQSDEHLNQEKTKRKQAKRSLTCPDCGKNFPRKSLLTLHVRVHTGEKPFTCVECGRSFPRKDRLKTHKSSHRRETLHLSMWKELHTKIKPEHSYAETHWRNSCHVSSVRKELHMQTKP